MLTWITHVWRKAVHGGRRNTHHHAGSRLHNNGLTAVQVVRIRIVGRMWSIQLHDEDESRMTICKKINDLHHRTTHYGSMDHLRPWAKLCHPHFSKQAYNRRQI